MKLNKKVQLGLLFALYLTRSGRTTLASAAEGLDVSEDFLAQVARLLRMSNVVKAFKGPTGGYELNGEPTVIQVINAIQPIRTVGINSLSSHEHRALLQLSMNLQAALTPVLNRKIKNVGNEVIATDMARLRHPSPSARNN